MLVHSTSDFLSLCLGIVKTSGVFPFSPSSSLGIVDVHCLSRLGASGRRSACLLFAERVRSVYDRASKSASHLHSATSSPSPTHESKWLSSYCAFLNCASRCIHEIPYSPANTCTQRLINRAHSRTFDCSPVFSWAETFMPACSARQVLLIRWTIAFATLLLAVLAVPSAQASEVPIGVSASQYAVLYQD